MTTLAPSFVRAAAAALALLVVATTGPAQIGTREFGIYPDATNATGRPGPNKKGALVVGSRADCYRGVGGMRDQSGRIVGRVNGMRAVIQDQDASTMESFAFTILRDDPARPGQPDESSAGELVRIPLTMPQLGAGTRAASVAATLQTPFDRLPDDDFYFGVELPEAPVFASDGLSLHMATYKDLVGNPNPRDNPRDGAPNVTWLVDRTNSGVHQPLPERTHAVWLLTEAPVFQVGADIAPALQKGPNPNYGVAGCFPDLGRGDGVTFRYRGTRPGGTLFVLLGVPKPGPGIELPVLDNRIYLDPSILVVAASGTIPSTKELELRPLSLAQGRIPATVSGSFGAMPVAIFSDGFESGDTSAWTMSAGR